MPFRLLAAAVVFWFCGAWACARTEPLATEIDAHLRPYVETGNFAGTVLVKKDGKVVFEKAYGFADRERHIANTAATEFHIASVSMQFTAAAILRLVDQGALKLDDPVGAFIPGTPGGNKITVRDLLTERSGLPDINSFSDYEDILQHHQTPASLIAKIEGRPLLFEPGSKFLHEEHSAYNLLALIVEKKTGLPFRAAMKQLVFEPFGLKASGADDDSERLGAYLATGYAPEGIYGLKPAGTIHWSAKTGNASIFTTARDQAEWIESLFRGKALSASSREAVLDTSQRIGYGWFKEQNKRFGEPAFSMNGRAPGFASFVLHLPNHQTTVILFSNIYSSATTTIGEGIAALTLGLPYVPFHPRNPAPTAAELQNCSGTFQFGADFYQPNAKVTLQAQDQELTLHWPSGEVSPLIPLGPDHFVDRAYWQELKIERNAAGGITGVIYGRFSGAVLAQK